MTCATCGEKMTEGMIAVHGTIWGYLRAGRSIQHVWWQPGGRYMDGVKILPSGEKRPAFRCEECRVLVVPDD